MSTVTQFLKPEGTKNEQMEQCFGKEPVSVRRGGLENYKKMVFKHLKIGPMKEESNLLLNGDLVLTAGILLQYI